MKEHHLRTPLEFEDISQISLGDIVYLSGRITTGRDMVHKRVIEEGIDPPIDLKGLALFHAGPIVKKDEGGWRIVAIGSTTSMRMEKYEAEFIERTGIRMIIGKGFMGSKTAKACAETGCIVGLLPGGCAALFSKKVREIVGVYWEDLGIPEAMWVLEVEDLGPIYVTIDTRGENLHDLRRKSIEDSARIALEKLKRDLSKLI
ncbi:MAG: FumA C-terminus/TtdB family hydratase beta subunit [Nitrososphaerota archaeon]|nr:FumA C-terminus/TtdB family hydratase beta subunit [Nitrososphaerota archaeon]